MLADQFQNGGSMNPNYSLDPAPRVEEDFALSEFLGLNPHPAEQAEDTPIDAAAAAAGKMAAKSAMLVEMMEALEVRLRRVNDQGDPPTKLS